MFILLATMKFTWMNRNRLVLSTHIFIAYLMTLFYSTLWHQPLVF